MATQGVVSVLSGGRVLMKLVAGIDGDLAQEVATELEACWPLTVDEAYDLALNIGFGFEYSLVVQTEEGIRHCDGDGRLKDRYYETFQDPRFNPRWRRGTADHVVVVEV